MSDRQRHERRSRNDYDVEDLELDLERYHLHGPFFTHRNAIEEVIQRHRTASLQFRVNELEEALGGQFKFWVNLALNFATAFSGTTFITAIEPVATLVIDLADEYTEMGEDFARRNNGRDFIAQLQMYVVYYSRGV